MSHQRCTEENLRAYVLGQAQEEEYQFSEQEIADALPRLLEQLRKEGFDTVSPEHIPDLGSIIRAFLRREKIEAEWKAMFVLEDADPVANRWVQARSSATPNGFSPYTPDETDC